MSRALPALLLRLVRPASLGARPRPLLIYSALLLAALLSLVPSSSGVRADGDNRFGVIISGEVSDRAVRHVLDTLGLRWWFGFVDPLATSVDPPGYTQVRLIRTDPSKPRLDLDALRAKVRAKPGAYWMIGNEPNVPGQDLATPGQYADLFLYYSSTIKIADPTAKIVAPNVLNSVETCSGCGGFTRGIDWITAFRQEYRRLASGAEPPVDVWALHAYDIAWTSVPMTDPEFVKRQVTGFRQYVDTLPGGAQIPIWLSEFGVIWGYDCWEYADAAKSQIKACGQHRSDKMEAFLRDVGSWLHANAVRLRLERWFVYASFAPPEPFVVGADRGAGILLFDRPNASAQLTSLGIAYRQLASGLAPATRYLVYLPTIPKNGPAG
ncbi:MAG: hypothetical protein HY329_06445 [Chloroflexi bacterium]|nr:hypothetical protein [Chloroflexota bacterium]